MNEGGALTWREVMDKHHSALVDEISERLDSEVRQAVSSAVSAADSRATGQLEQACEGARRSQVESLNQVLRRLRVAGEEQVLQLAAEGCAPYAAQLVVLVFENSQARCAASHGLNLNAVTDSGAAIDDETPTDGSLSFEISSAPAIVAAIESRDPVISIGTDAEISPSLARAFHQTFRTTNDRKAYLFPIVARHSVVGMLVASGVRLSAPIELLCEAAGMRLEGAAPSVAVPSQVNNTGFVQLAPGVPASETSAPRSWSDLSLEDQKLHLQAQRMARVRVAEMRLYHENELRSGTAAGNIYAALQKEIDAARDQFLQSFLSKSPTMVDYLHLEIMRNLAHDNDQLLGNTYPGPMV
jgi:hypothetical protein